MSTRPTRDKSGKNNRLKKCEPRLTVRFTPVGDAQDQNDPGRVIDFVDRAVIANANPPIVALHQFLTSWRTGIHTEGDHS